MKRLTRSRGASERTRSLNRRIARDRVGKIRAGNTFPETLLRPVGNPTYQRPAEASCSILSLARAPREKWHLNLGVILLGLNFTTSMQTLPKRDAAKLRMCVVLTKQNTH